MRTNPGRGHSRHHGEEFAELLETEGAGFGVDLSLSGSQVVLDVPASHLERALELFAEAVTEPSLADATSTAMYSYGWPRSSRRRPTPPRRRASRSGRPFSTRRSGPSRMSGGEPDTVRQVTPEAVTGLPP